MARHTLIRSLHDLGLAGWFGGSLMGLAGTQVAAAANRSEKQEAQRGTDPAAAWLPVMGLSIGAHVLGGLGLIIVNRDRHRRQDAVMRTTLLKTAVTGAALVSTAYQGIVDSQLRDLEAAAVDEPSSDRTTAEAQLRSRGRFASWATTLLTGTLIVLAAKEGELMTASEVTRGVLGEGLNRLSDQVSDGVMRARDTVMDRLGELPGESIVERFADIRDNLIDKVDADKLSDAVQNVRETVLDRVHLTA